MKTVLSVFATLLLLSACKPEVPVETAPAAPDAAQAPTQPSVAEVPPPPTAPVTPSFDCSKASSEAEKIVCSDDGLAALDKRLSELYAAELAKPGASKDLAVMQRGWVKGRDDCWKAEDKKLCVEEEYRTRIAYLQINSPGAMGATAVAFKCDNSSNPLYMAYYHDYDGMPAVITLGSDQATIFPQPAASGVKYGRTGISFWEHQGKVSVDFFGTKLACTPLPAATSNL